MQRRIKRTVSSDQENPLPIICLEEIVSDAITKSLFKVKDVGELKAPTIQLGVDKIRAKTPLGKYLVDFAHNSTIHGLNHIVARRRHPVERFLAGLFVAGALVCLALLSWNSWDRYQHAATVITLNHDYRSFKIPNPAFIMCPINQVNDNKFPAVFKKYNIQDTPKAREFFKFISNVTYDTMSKVMNYDEVPSSLWLEILHDLWTDIIAYPTSKDKRFTETTDDIITEMGICKAFSYPVGIYFTAQYWRANNWSTVPIDIEKLPSTIYETRKIPKHYLLKCVETKVILIYPLDVARYNGVAFNVTGTQWAEGNIEIQESRAHERLKTLPQYQRHCAFPEDGGLTMSPIYSRGMCFFECTMKRIQQFCNCLPHFARPKPDVPICNAEQLRCIGKNVENILNGNLNTVRKCNCIRDCNTISYSLLKFSAIDMHAVALGKTDMNFIINFPRDMQYRILYFGFTDFLAAVGGAAGLFVGASIISFIEIFYYATLRLFWYILKLRSQKRKRIS